jgi:uncharacterized membrane protein YphA (DoxX/SURF4 family)
MQGQWRKWVSYAIGFVFITSGVMKFIMPEFKTMFASMGLPFPELTLFIIALLEVACGMLIAARIYARYAAVPLIFIMFGAIFLTKMPILTTAGFLTFAFESRLDVVMLMLLAVIWRN